MTSLPGRKRFLNGYNYHVSVQGNGERTVLLLHGMPDTSTLWKHLVPVLVDAGMRVIVPDMLGYGETDKPQEVRRYTIENHIQDMVTLLDQLNVDKVDLVGHDWGAIVGWDFVLAHPGRLRSHVAVSIGHPACFFSPKSIEQLMENWYMWLHHLPGSTEMMMANDGYLWKAIWGDQPETDEEVWPRINNYAAMNAMLNWDRANPISAVYTRTLNGEVLPKCKVPTMGVWSTKDFAVCKDQMTDSEPYMDAPWRFEQIDDVGHWIPLDAPDKLNKLVLEWLEAN